MEYLFLGESSEVATSTLHSLLEPSTPSMALAFLIPTVGVGQRGHCESSLYALLARNFHGFWQVRGRPSMAKTFRAIMARRFLYLRGELKTVDRLSAPRRLLRLGCRDDRAQF